MVLDRSWKIVYSNTIIREIYPSFTFLPDASYDDLIWHCIDSRIIDSPELYVDPEQYISNLKDILGTWGKSPGVQAVAERSLTRSGRYGASACATPRRCPRKSQKETPSLAQVSSRPRKASRHSRP